MFATRRRERAWRPLTLALVATGLARAVGVASCGSTGDGSTTQELVVPLRTAKRLERGEDVTVMPTELRFEVGGTLRIRNEDVALQAVGPYRVAAGDEFEITFGSAGRFEGVCAPAEGERYEIVITE